MHANLTVFFTLPAHFPGIDSNFFLIPFSPIFILFCWKLPKK